jgi:hypothetical protein
VRDLRPKLPSTLDPLPSLMATRLALLFPALPLCPVLLVLCPSDNRVWASLITGLAWGLERGLGLAV